MHNRRVIEEIFGMPFEQAVDLINSNQLPDHVQEMADDIEWEMQSPEWERQSPEMERVSTTPSTAQDPEAAQRTEENEGDMLERIRAKNAESRKNLGE